MELAPNAGRVTAKCTTTTCAAKPHPFFTSTDLPTAQADIVHRRHAIIETVFGDLIV